MKGLALVVFFVIALSLSDARYRKNPNIEVFEIRENQITKQLNVKPVKLQYDVESEENNSQLAKLKKILLSYKKKKAEDASRDVLKKIKNAKVNAGQGAGKKQKQPVVLLVSADYIEGVESPYRSDEETLKNSFVDETRNDVLKPGSEVVFDIVPPNRARKNMKQPILPAILRSIDLAEDRTSAPQPSRGRERPYVYDYGNEHY